MTDYRSNVAGDYPDSAPEISVWLNEGAITVVSAGYGAGMRSQKFCTFAAELREGDWVAIANDSDCTFANLGPLPVVEKAVNTESLTFIQLTGTPEPCKIPAASTDADTLAKRITGGYLRKCRAKIYGGVTGVKKATVMANGANATVPGVATTLNFNMTSAYAATTVKNKLCFDSAAANGVGVIPFHYVPAGVDGDLYSCLVGLTAPMYSVTGA
jgi:hypothetical protein